MTKTPDQSPQARTRAQLVAHGVELAQRYAARLRLAVARGEDPLPLLVKLAQEENRLIEEVLADKTPRAKGLRTWIEGDVWAGCRGAKRRPLTAQQAGIPPWAGPEDVAAYTGRDTVE